MPLNKQCRKCNESKLIDEFDKNRLVCKKCIAMYFAEKYRANPIPAKRRAAKWIVDNRARYLLSRRRYREANRQAISARKLARYHKNPELQKKRSAKWRAKNKEHIAIVNAAWDKEHREWLAAKQSATRSRKLNATPKWANADKILDFYIQARKLTEEQGTKFSVDHIVPLKSKLVCGFHVEHNLQVIPFSQNSAKGNRIWPDMPEAECRP